MEFLKGLRNGVVLIGIIFGLDGKNIRVERQCVQNVTIAKIMAQ